jgi:hypothetical protein
MAVVMNGRQVQAQAGDQALSESKSAHAYGDDEADRGFGHHTVPVGRPGRQEAALPRAAEQFEDGTDTPIQQATKPSDAPICSARNIPDPATADPRFEEGPPRRNDPSIEAFSRHVAEGQRLEIQIETLEAEADQLSKPLIIEQLVRGFRACSLVATGQIPSEVVDNVIAEAGVKRHGNEKIPCSALMRAIVGESEARGTPRFQRKKQRATTYASAVDFAVQQGMSQEAFEAELSHPPTLGERHGIEHLATLGRKLRRGEPTGSSDPPADMPFRVEGDLSPVPPGVHLMVYRVVPGEPTLGAPLTVPESLFRQVLAAQQIDALQPHGLISHSTH